LTQEALAEAVALSVDMISKIETGATGARFPVIERLAGALGVDPAELFTTEIPTGAISRGAFSAVSMKLSDLSEAELSWISDLIDVALRRKIPEAVAGVERSAPKPTRHGRKRVSAKRK
jgi:transcriptional regulator with XRE-family HTH domain